MTRKKADELIQAMLDLAFLEAAWEIIRERQMQPQRKTKSLYSDRKRRFVENGKRYRFPDRSYKFPKNDDGINIMSRITHQLAMPS